MNWYSDENEILLNPRLPAEDLEFLREAAASGLIKRKHRSTVVLASSGSGSSTGARHRKLFFIHKDAFLKSARAVNAFFDLSPSENWAAALPIFHVGGLGIHARAFEAGSRVFTFEGEWNPVKFADWLIKQPVRLLSLVPTQLYDLIQNNVSAPAGLRFVFIGGAALEARLEARAAEMGWNCVSTYGMTETCSMIAIRRATDGEGFRLLPHAEAKVTQDGLLALKATSMATEVLETGAAATAPAAVADADGWYVTQDRAELRDGKIFFLGRAGDQVKISGELVSLTELRRFLEESARAEGAGPSQFALIAVADERRGNDLVLVAETDARIAEAVRSRFDAKVAPYEKIRRVYADTPIPRSELGKPLWGLLNRVIAAKG